MNAIDTRNKRKLKDFRLFREFPYVPFLSTSDCNIGTLLIVLRFIIAENTLCSNQEIGD